MPRATTLRYRRQTGQKLEYEITADERGTYWIRHPGETEVLRMGVDALAMNQMREWGPERAEEAIERAKSDIEALRGMDRE